MADIFISYAKKNRSRVEPLAKTLEEQGWTVWWDPIIPTGKDFDDVIEDEISKARCVLVIWTKMSVKSKYVKGEAREALNRGILVPIEIESGIKPPFDFRSTQTLSLIDWDGSNNFPGFQKLIADIVSILGEPPAEKQKRQREEVEREAEKERRRKQEKDRKLREEEQKFKEVVFNTEEELNQKKTESKRKALVDKRLNEKEELKRISPKPRKLSIILKSGLVIGALVLLITGGWLYYDYQQKIVIRNKLDQVQIEKKEFSIKIEPFYKQVKELESAVTKVDNQLQLNELLNQRDNLIHQVESLREQAIKVGFESQLEQLRERLEKVQIQLANKDKEFSGVRQEMMKLDSQTLILESAVAEIDKPEQIKELYEQKDMLIQTASALSEQATKVGLRSRLEKLQNRLERIHIELANKERERLLRDTPIEVTNNDFYKVIQLDENRRPRKFIRNDFKANVDVVIDRATGLMWQKSGSDRHLIRKEAQVYVKELNKNRFAGYTDWRLPTMPELISLLTPEKQSNGLYINPIFDNKQRYCWSSDTVKDAPGEARHVDFDHGIVSQLPFFDDCYVRVVRRAE